MKKCLSAFIAIVFICSILLTSSASIVYAEDTSSSNGTFEKNENEIEYDFIPDNLLLDSQKHITREEFCDVLVHLYKYLTIDSAVISAVNPFTDTNNPAVLEAYELGIVSGVGNGKFNPQEKLTIQEKAVMLYRTLKILDPNLDTRVEHDLNFTDEDQISPWALEAVTYLNANHIITGDENNELNPSDNITRADSHEITYAAALLASGSANYLCYGYNVIAEGYIDSANISTRFPILDKTKLAETNYETTVDMRKAYIDDYVSTNATDFYNAFNTKAKVDYKGVLFSGSVEADYGKAEDMQKKSVLIKHMEWHPITEKYLVCSNEQLKDLLSDEFKNDLTTKTPEDIFDTYGTHLITRYSLGGRIELNLKYNNEKSITKEQISARVNASYGKGSGEADAELQKQAQELISNSELNFKALGGTNISGSNIEDLSSKYDSWIESMEKTPDICMISDFRNSMVPLWELTDDAKVAEALKAQFDKYVVKADSMLGRYTYKEAPVVKPFITDIIVVTDKDKNKALAKIPSNYKVVRINPGTGTDSEPLDANHGAGGDYIYIAYLLGTDKSKAIGYIRLSEGENNGNGYGYTMIPVDLNKGARGEFIYLNYHRTVSSEAPLTEISGYYGTQYTLPAGWKSLPTNIDLNKGAKGDFVYLVVK